MEDALVQRTDHHDGEVRASLADDLVPLVVSIYNSNDSGICTWFGRLWGQHDMVNGMRRR